ncbi:MAG: hypothetical protein ACRBDI_06010 [Alphaproteobacteria bacterium]
MILIFLTPAANPVMFRVHFARKDNFPLDDEIELYADRPLQS